MVPFPLQEHEGQLQDVRVTDRAQILRVATWLHRLDLAATYGVEIAASPQVEDYDFGPLLEYFLMPKLTYVIVEETTETTVMTDEETKSEATPLGGPTDEATGHHCYSRIIALVTHVNNCFFCNKARMLLTSWGRVSCDDAASAASWEPRPPFEAAKMD